MSKQQLPQQRDWYVIHTYSGYEENVKRNLLQRVESMNMEHKIFDVIIPEETKIKIQNGKRKTVKEKIHPGYVIVDMIVTDESWYVVRNTPNVTGFVGTGITPIPLSKEEKDEIKRKMKLTEPKMKIDLSKGDLVKITDGPFKNFEGKVSNVDENKGKLKVLVDMFGRETPVELDFLQVKKS